MARTFLDLPPGSGAPRRAPPRESAAAAEAVVEPVRPAIERTLDPDSVLALLPRDKAGHVDWVAAVRQGVIRPRPGVGAVPGTPAGAFQFAFDFFFKGPDTTYDAWFPHSVHAELMACRQCHGRIIRYRGETITMSDLFAGKYCGECHGKVSFPVATGCDRCHPKLDLPPDRAQAELIGDVVMSRFPSDSGNASGVRADSLPPARFPHWVHRIRYQCRTCHVDLFEPRAGANVVRMSDISAGRACGGCHDGATAFQAGFGACQRCHATRSDASAGR